MATTSGTVGTTQFTVDRLLDHAYGRCGVLPSKITPESDQRARESLFAFMVSMAARGINLWCVEKNIVGLYVDQATYVLPPGTLNILNWIHSTPSQADVSATTFDATSQTRQLSAATQIVRWGFKPAGTFTGTVVLAGSSDGLAFTTLVTQASATWTAGTWYWFDLDPMQTYEYFRVTAGVAATFTEFYLASSVRDIKISPWNRDDWANQPNKNKTGNPATNVYFEKLISPQFTLWPVPDDAYNQVSLWRHRQIQDVGDLTNTLEIPTRWIEEIMWQLSFRLSLELPVGLVPPERASIVQAMAEKFQLEAEQSETDGSPIYLHPNISVYTR